MTIFSVLGFLFKLLGFTQWAEAMYGYHEAVEKAQEAANAPLTKSEEISDIDNLP